MWPPAMLRRPPIVLLPFLVIVVLASAWLFLFALGRHVPRPPPPNPNGYDDFIKAGGLLSDPTALEALSVKTSSIRR